jgi:hypothetical protein
MELVVRIDKKLYRYRKAVGTRRVSETEEDSVEEERETKKART